MSCDPMTQITPAEAVCVCVCVCVAPGERNSFPLQYSCLENSMDRGAQWSIVHGVAKCVCVSVNVCVCVCECVQQPLALIPKYSQRTHSFRRDFFFLYFGALSLSAQSALSLSSRWLREMAPCVCVMICLISTGRLFPWICPQKQHPSEHHCVYILLKFIEKSTYRLYLSLMVEWLR